MVFRRQEVGPPIRFGTMDTPSLGAATGLGLRALIGQAWLLAPGVLVAGARRAATLPAFGVLWLLMAQGAVGGFRARPLDPTAPIEGALATLASPRGLAVVLGLLGAGALLGAALRVAWIAGALPTLGAEMAGLRRAPRFAPGLVYGFPRVLGTAALGLVLELSGAVFSWTLALAALWTSVYALGAGGSALLAAAVAAALVIALAVAPALSAVADAAVARAALRAEGIAEAFAGGTLRFLSRPGTFLLAALLFGLVGAFVPAVVQSFGGVATGFARGVSPVLLVGPELMLGLLALGVAAAVDLWWLGTIAALACGGEINGRAGPPVPTRG